VRKEAKELQHKLASFGIKLKKKELKKLERYIDLLKEWNKLISLISKNEIRRVWGYHVFDSLVVSKYIGKKSSIADWGSGAGFPGIPVAIIREDVEVHLMESKKKKAAFLLRIIEELGLSNAKVWANRAEEIEKRFDVITLRQVGKMRKVLPMVIEKLKEKGKVIFFKGENYEKEIKEASKIIEKYRLEYNTKIFYLPGGIKRVFVFFKRRNDCS